MIFIFKNTENKTGKTFFFGKGVKGWSLAVMLIFSIQLAFSQQLPIFSLYQENGFALNPAITGSEGYGILGVSYRHQWTGVQEGPRTVSGGYRMPIYSKGDQFQRAGNFIGVGGYVLNDKTGPTSYFQGSVTMAYHLSFAKINPFSWAAFLRKSHMSFGLTASAHQYRLNSTELIPESANDLLVIAADDARILPNAGLGIYYYYDKFFIGFSMPQVVPMSIRFTDDFGESAIKRINHYYAVAGGKIPLGNKMPGSKTPKGYVYKFYLEPMVWFRQVNGAPYQYDIYARFRHKDLVWVGAGYRSSKTMVVDAGFMVKKQLRFGYAYDLGINEMSSYLGSTHEVIVAYLFDLGPKYKR